MKLYVEIMLSKYWCYTVTFCCEKRRLKFLARYKHAIFGPRVAGIYIYNTVASEYILAEMIRLGTEITCLGAVQYRFNSITCFLFMRRFRSYGCSSVPASVGLIYLFFFHHPILYVRGTEWPGRARGRESSSVSLVQVSRSRKRPSDDNSLTSSSRSSMGSAREKGEIFESDDECFLFYGADVISLSERVSKSRIAFITSRCIMMHRQS